MAINPLLMLNFVFIDSDSATVEGNTYTLDISSDSYLSAKLILGIEAEYAISEKLNSIFRAMYAFEMGDESYDYTYSFANSYINGIDYAGGEAGTSSAILGFGLSYDFSETCSAYFDYNAYIYESLITHSLNLSIGIKF